MGKLSDSEKLEVVERYIAGESTEKLATRYRVTPQSIQSILRRRGIVCRRRKYAINENYFDQIDSEEKAYWLGYLFAEGSLDKNERRKTSVLRIKISSKDRDQLEKLKMAMGSTYPIKKAGDRDAVYLDASSKHLAQKLAGFNFGPSKAWAIQMPELPENLVQHFIRGFFDGDGWISKTPDGSPSAGFASCSRSLLESFRQWFSIKMGRQVGSIVVRKRSHIPNQHDNFRLHYSGRPSTLGILALMYEKSTVCLPRKKDRFRSFLSGTSFVT